MLPAAPPPWNPPPVVYASPASPQAGPLDLASASLLQQGTQLQLRITTRGPWTPGALDESGPLGLCVTLASTTTAQLCVAGVGGHPVLRRVPLSPPGPVTQLAATVT